MRLLAASGLRFMGGFARRGIVLYRSAFPGDLGTEFALLGHGQRRRWAISAVGGGYLADRWARTEPRAVVWLPAAGSLLAIPLWVGTLTAPSLETSLCFLFAEYLAAECWFGPVIAALQKAAPPGTQGLTQGALAFLTFAGNLAPALLGAVLAQAGPAPTCRRCCSGRCRRATPRRPPSSCTPARGRIGPAPPTPSAAAPE